MAVLLVGHLRYDWANAGQATNDHLIYSKGHASPLRSMYRAVGMVDEDMAGEGIAARVIDLSSVEPLDHDAIIDACRITGNGLVVVEDHNTQGGIGGTLMGALADANAGELHVTRLDVICPPMSGEFDELLDASGISARHTVSVARELVEAQA